MKTAKPLLRNSLLHEVSTIPPARRGTKNRAILDFDTASFVIRLVCAHFNLFPADLESRSRQWNLVWPRWVCIYLIANYSHYSAHAIGSLFGRNHVTILNARQGVENQIETDPANLKEVSGFDTLVSNWCAIHRPDYASLPAPSSARLNG